MDRITDKDSREPEQVGVITNLMLAMQCLMSDHVQNNKHRLGPLGATDLHDAIIFIKTAAQGLSESRDQSPSESVSPLKVEEEKR